MQYCDNSVPFHHLIYIACRGYIMRLKLALYAISPSPDDPNAKMPYAPAAFQLARDSMKIVHLAVWTDPGLRQWQWHWKDWFGFHTLRVLVQEIASRRGSSSSEAIEAWMLVRRAATLVVSACKLGPEKARLVGDLRILIEAGDVWRKRSADGYVYGNGAMRRPAMGAKAHSFPGMNAASASVSGLTLGYEEDGGGRDTMPYDFDLGRVNWKEMDRVLVRLEGYTGG